MRLTNVESTSKYFKDFLFKLSILHTPLFSYMVFAGNLECDDVNQKFTKEFVYLKKQFRLNIEKFTENF